MTTVDISKDRELCELVMLYLGDGFEMACCLVMTVGERLCMVTEVSWDTELFESVELYSGNNLEMAGCLVLTVGERDYMVTVEVSLD